jgi:ATP/maltotriose-dependent transcriptional regulator MalT/DNA-binding SARP family transcriptional activator
MGRGATLAKTTRPSAAAVTPRERLFAALDARRRAALLWVHGPPGCGKTALVSSYLDARASNGIWYQIDPGDADPASLCLYLGQAVNGDGRSLPLFTAEYRSEPQAFARHYFRRLFDALDPPFLLVFDNYHELGADGPVHDMLREAAAELPADGCVVILSRAPPPPAFIRMRANRELEVLDWDALRLNREESDAIVHSHLGEVDLVLLDVLYERTGGWAAALILALEQGHVPGADPPAAGIAPQLLFDYLAGEVVSNFEPEVRELLTRTACVEEMSVELAAALSGDARAGELLDGLHRRHQMVTVKAGERGPVYACHPLLREYLLAHAERSLAPAARAAIVQHAAELLERDSAPDAAMRLLAQHGEAPAMAAVVLRNAATMVAEGRIRTLERWLDTLPDAARDADPWLCYWHGACRFQRDPGQARRIFDAAFMLFQRERPDDGQGLALSAAYAMHAVIFALEDFSALDEWIERAQVLANRPRLGAEAQARLAVCLFMAVVFRQPHNARIGEWAERALAACRTLPDAQLRLSTQLLLAINLNYTGQFDRALEFLRTMRAQAEAPGAQPLERTTLMAVESMYYMLNADAQRCVKAVFDGLEIGDETGVTLWSYHLLSNGVAGALGVGDLDTAAELLERMQDYARESRRLDRSGYHHYRAWHAMLRGDLNSAWREQRVALALAEEVGCPFYVALCRLSLAQVLVERGEERRAARELRRVHAIVRRMNNALLHFAALLCLADMAFACDRQALGLRALARGLQLGREHGFTHFLWWLPAVMSRVCAAALEADLEVDYVRELIRRRALRPPPGSAARVRWPWPIEIDTLGGFRLRVANVGVPGGRLSGKPQALLRALVGLGGGARVEEGVLAALLWPRIDADYARRSLTTTLHRLRKLLGEDRAVLLRHGRLSLDPDVCRVDLQALDATLAAIEALDQAAPGHAEALTALADELLDCYRGPFMDGDDEAAFVPMRERVRNRVLAGLDSLARACEEAGAPQQALALYRRAIEQDPLAEVFHRRLMLSLRDTGRAAEAVEAYARCKSLLEAAGSAGPSAETQAIYEAVCKEI